MMFKVLFRKPSQRRTPVTVGTFELNVQNSISMRRHWEGTRLFNEFWLNRWPIMTRVMQDYSFLQYLKR